MLFRSVVFRRLHPHQNPGTGDLPGKDRAPNLGPGLRACARLDRHAAPAFPVQVEFHPHIPLRIPDRLHDQRTGDHQSSLTPHQIPGTHRTRQPLITPRTTAGTRPKQNTTAIVAATAAEAGSVVGVGFGVLGGQSGSCGSASGASPARPGSSSPSSRRQPAGRRATIETGPRRALQSGGSVGCAIFHRVLASPLPLLSPPPCQGRGAYGGIRPRLSVGSRGISLPESSPLPIRPPLDAGGLNFTPARGDP